MKKYRIDLAGRSPEIVEADYLDDQVERWVDFRRNDGGNASHLVLRVRASDLVRVELVTDR